MAVSLNSQMSNEAERLLDIKKRKEVRFVVEEAEKKARHDDVG